MALFTMSVGKTPAKLTEEALASFDKAQNDLAAAQAAIEAQQQDHAQAIAIAQEKHAEAQTHIDRLARVRGKLADLYA